MDLIDIFVLCNSFLWINIISSSNAVDGSSRTSKDKRESDIRTLVELAPILNQLMGYGKSKLYEKETVEDDSGDFQSSAQKSFTLSKFVKKNYLESEEESDKAEEELNNDVDLDAAKIDVVTLNVPKSSPSYNVISQLKKLSPKLLYIQNV